MSTAKPANTTIELKLGNFIQKFQLWLKINSIPIVKCPRPSIKKNHPPCSGLTIQYPRPTKSRMLKLALMNSAPESSFKLPSERTDVLTFMSEVVQNVMLRVPDLQLKKIKIHT